MRRLRDTVDAMTSVQQVDGSTSENTSSGARMTRGNHTNEGEGWLIVVARKRRCDSLVMRTVKVQARMLALVVMKRQSATRKME